VMTVIKGHVAVGWAASHPALACQLTSPSCVSRLRVLNLSAWRGVWGVGMKAPDITALMCRCVAAAYPAKHPICLSGTKLWVSPRSEHSDGERISLVSLPGVDPQPHTFTCRACKRS
jgi:hypothetical protein